MNSAVFHLSGPLHLCGKSHFIADEPPLQGQLYAKFLFSPVAHAQITNLDISAAEKIPGVIKIITADSIPGENQIGTVVKDEPLFPETEIMYVGQPIAMVLAENEYLAELAVKKIVLKYKELPAIFDPEEAYKEKQGYIQERIIARGDVETALKNAPFTLSGKTETSGQEHFYLESQRCLAVPMENSRIILHTATQSTMEVQEIASRILGIPVNDVIIEVPRLGGAFGGKERGATIWACMAALGAFLTQKPVLVKLTRDEDMHITGKRHPFTSLWKVGYDEHGKILAYDILLLANGGAYTDLSIAILERAMFHSENAYYIPNIKIKGFACKTNLPPNTAFRGFGAPQGIFVIENILAKIAEQLKIDPLEIRLQNAYQNGDKTPYGQEISDCRLTDLFNILAEKTNYLALKQAVEVFNKNNTRFKRGIGIIPVKFGISFTTTLLNQGSALVWVYIDGSVSVSTGGVEMGQELSTKVAIVVAKVLGIPVHQIRVESSNSQRIGNASPTAASTGSDINGNAARIAAEKIKMALTECAVKLLKQKHQLNVSPEDIVFKEGKVFYKENPDACVNFEELVRFAHSERVPLAAYGYYKTPALWFDRDKGSGNPFHYFVWGVALAEVEMDTLLGEHKIIKLTVMHENGQTLNEEIDRGQIEGAIMQGIGWCTMEDLKWNEKGVYLSANPSTYKIPGIRNLPEELEIEMIPSATEEASVFGSKGIGEPPLIYGLSVFFALQAAAKEAKKDAELSFPATPESVLQCLDGLYPIG